ncbi:hypothetical protein [Xanthomonas campestris]|uniref:hypothetical protein n=1 Tax=Xanthomonas campestris TaxID=339 RepID=UPI001F5BF60D|nr:hypothetical protein [Xanthomonas campestris]
MHKHPHWTTILARNYAQTWAKYRAKSLRCWAPWSMYNTGNESRGLSNGYVSWVSQAAGVAVNFQATGGRAAAGPPKPKPMLFP